MAESSGPRCRVCRDPRRAEIDAALAELGSETAVARRFELSSSAVRGHHLRHLLGVGKAQRIHRRCPACSTVRLGSAYRVAAGSGGARVEHWVRCPACGHVAPVRAFTATCPPAGAEGAS
jgi:hypothetical protein